MTRSSSTKAMKLLISSAGALFHAVQADEAFDNALGLDA
jgi:hypothetical protein